MVRPRIVFVCSSPSLEFVHGNFANLRRLPRAPCPPSGFRRARSSAHCQFLGLVLATLFGLHPFSPALHEILILSGMALSGIKDLEILKLGVALL
jgi:hypothetical protein